MFMLLQEKGSTTMETILLRKDSTKVPIFLNAVELPNRRYMAFCTDITERKRTENALNQKTKVLFNFLWVKGFLLG